MLKQRDKTSGIVMNISFLTFFLCMLPALLQAGEVTLVWDPNTENNLAGYKLYYDGDSDSEMYQGTGANEGDSPVIIYLEDLADAGSPVYTLTGLEEGLYYYFALTAFDTDGLESDFSDEVGTLIGFESAYNKAVDDSSDISSDTSADSDGTSDGFDSPSEGSGGQCFISGIVGGHAEKLQPAVAALLLLLAAAAAVHSAQSLKNVKVILRIRKRRQLRP